MDIDKEKMGIFLAASILDQSRVKGSAELALEVRRLLLRFDGDLHEVAVIDRALNNMMKEDQARIAKRLFMEGEGA